MENNSNKANECLFERLEKYKMRKQEEKMKRKEETQRNKPGSKRSSDDPCKEHPITKRQKKNVSIQTSMKEKLEQWKASKGDPIQSERRTTFAFGNTIQSEVMTALRNGFQDRRQTITATKSRFEAQKESLPRKNVITAHPSKSVFRFTAKSAPSTQFQRNEKFKSNSRLTQSKVDQNLKRQTFTSSSVNRCSSLGKTLKGGNTLAQQKCIERLTANKKQESKGFSTTTKVLKKNSMQSSNVANKTRSVNSTSKDSDSVNKNDVPKTPGRKFVHVASRIDTGLKTKPLLSDRSNKPVTRKPEVHLTKTAIQRMNNLSKANVKPEKPHGLNVPIKKGNPVSVTNSNRIGGSKPGVHARINVQNKTNHTKRGIFSSQYNKNGMKEIPSYGARIAGVKPILPASRSLSENRTLGTTMSTVLRSKSTSSTINKTQLSKRSDSHRERLQKKSCMSNSSSKISTSCSQPKGIVDSGVLTSQSRHQVHFLTPTAESPLIKNYRKTPIKKTPLKSSSHLMRERLNAWLEAKGKTPSRFKHLMCFHEEGSLPENIDGGLSVNELQLQQQQLEIEQGNDSVFEDSVHVGQPQNQHIRGLLSECLLLLQSGCPLENVSAWLDEIKKIIPENCTEAKFYILKSHIAEEEGRSDADIIDIFEDAVRNNAAPPDEVANALTEFVERMNSKKRKAMSTPSITPRKRRSVNKENMIPSSTMKYSLSKATPFFTRLRAKADGHPTPCGIVTPVRRSARLSKTPLPSALQDHDILLETLEDLSPNTKQNYLFQPNKALQNDFEEVADESLSEQDSKLLVSLDEF